MKVGMPPEAMGCTDSQKEELIKNAFSRNLSLAEDPIRDKRLRFEVAQALRNAQNYPIQCLSSVLVGLGIQYMTDYLREHEMTSRVDCFTHDAGDIDTQIADIPVILKALPEMSMRRIEAEFDMPVKTDFEIGLGGHTMIKLSKMQSDDRTVQAGFKGKRETVEKIRDKFELFGVKCKFDIEKEKTELKSMKELFMAKRAYAVALGQETTKVEGTLELDFTNVQRL